jgi:hypothetical protein
MPLNFWERVSSASCWISKACFARSLSMRAERWMYTSLLATNMSTTRAARIKLDCRVLNNYESTVHKATVVNCSAHLEVVDGTLHAGLLLGLHLLV